MSILNKLYRKDSHLKPEMILKEKPKKKTNTKIENDLKTIMNQERIKITEKPKDIKDETYFSAVLPDVIKILEAMNLNREEQAKVLGIHARTLQRALKKEACKLSTDQITRMGYMVQIYISLRTIYDINLSKKWLKIPQSLAPYNHQSPLEIILETGIIGMYHISTQLKKDENGQFVGTPEEMKKAEEGKVTYSEELLKAFKEGQ